MGAFSTANPDQLDLTLKNVLKFDAPGEAGIFLRKNLIVEAASTMMNIIAVESCIAGEGHRGTGLIDPHEIEYDYVSHLVTGLHLTDEGVDATIQVLGTPRGDVVRMWLETGFYYPRMRTTHVIQGGEIMALNFTTVDIIGGV